MVWRFERQGNEIKYGAKLTVREGPDGGVRQRGRDRRHRSRPACTSCSPATCRSSRTLQAWPHGFESPFKAEVYFCSTRVFTDLKWGTKNPVIARDAEFGPVRLRAFGTYAIRIKDPAVFLREVVGTDGHFTVDEISDQLRNIIVARFGTIVAGSGIPVLDLAANYDQLGQFVHRPDRARVRQLRPRAGHDPGRERLAAARGRAGDGPAHLDGRGRRPVASTPSSRRPRRCAPPPANPGAAGAGDRHDGGHGRGPAGEPMGRAAGRAAAAAPAAAAAGPAYHVAVDGKPTGPFTVEQLRAQVGKRRADPRDAWSGRQGMAGWQPAGEVAELAALFAAVPPPIPGAA